MRIRFIALCTGLLILAAPAAAQAKSTITLSGSTSVTPLASKLAKAYVKTKRGKVGFKILQGGSDIGVSDVARGRVTLGMSSRDPLPTDPGGLRFSRIARDGVCIATNAGNGIADMSQDTVQAIFSGRIRNWSDVPGAGKSGAIDLVVRNPASGTQDAFQNIFMGQNLRVSSSASQRPSNGRVQQAIASNPNAIGYVDFAFTKGLHTVSYKGIACSLRNAKSGQYGGVRSFWLVSRGAPTGAAAAWIKWIKSAKARRIIAQNWVPIK